MGKGILAAGKGVSLAARTVSSARGKQYVEQALETVEDVTNVLGPPPEEIWGGDVPAPEEEEPATYDAPVMNGDVALSEFRPDDMLIIEEGGTYYLLDPLTMEAWEIVEDDFGLFEGGQSGGAGATVTYPVH